MMVSVLTLFLNTVKKLKYNELVQSKLSQLNRLKKYSVLIST